MNALRTYNRIVGLAALVSSLSVFAPAFAQVSPPILRTAPDGAAVTYNVTADRACFLGPPSVPAVVLGTLIDTSGPNAGRLRTSLTPNSITLPDSWCNFNDNALTVSAQPIIGQGVAIPPTGFTRLVNFRVSASGWRRSGVPISVSTVSGATEVIGQGSVSATGTEAIYRVADIGLSIDQLSAAGPVVAGAGPLLVAAPAYQGQITVSIGPAFSTPASIP